MREVWKATGAAPPANKTQKTNVTGNIGRAPGAAGRLGQAYSPLGQGSFWQKWHRPLALIFAALSLYLAAAFAIVSVQQANIPTQGYATLVVFPAALFFGLCVFCLAGTRQHALLLGLFFGLGLYLALLSPNYNPIDEYGHHNYILYIVQNGTLPTVQENYSAFHPPLYYLVMAALTFFIKSEVVSLYFLRLVNLLLMLCIYLVLHKTLVLLKAHKIITSKHFLVDYLPFFWLFCTGFLYRCATVSNEVFTSLFASVSLYLLCRFTLEEKPPRLLWLPTALCIAFGILSRITNVFLLVLLVCVYLYRKQFGKMCAALLVVAVGVAPWFIQNLLRYGALTGAKPHLEYVFTALWHQDAPLGAKTLFLGLFNMPDRFFFPDDFWKIEHSVDFLSLALKLVLWAFMLFAIVRLFIFGVQFIAQKLRFTYSCEEKRRVIEMLAACGVLCILAMTFVMSYDANFDFFRGRYLYLAANALCILSALYVDKLPKKYPLLQTGLCGLLILVSSCFASYSFQRTFAALRLSQFSPLSS